MKKITTLILFVLIYNFGFGQSIFENPITGNDPSLDNPYITGQIVDPNITASGIGRGSGITQRNANNRYNTGNWVSGVLDPNQYFEFTLTPNTGFEINLINFIYTGQASGSGPTEITFRSSIDNFTSDIGVALIDGTTIDLNSSIYQGITTSITFRIFAWNATNNMGTYSINDFVFNGVVSPNLCPTSTTWQVNNTDPMNPFNEWSNGAPDINTAAIIDTDYNTITDGNFTACSLIVNTGVTLDVANVPLPQPTPPTVASYVEVENDVVVNGTLRVQTTGNFIQNNDASTFTNNGTSEVLKSTPPKLDWFFYTYWSSPVSNETIGNLFPVLTRRFRFGWDASNYQDIEINATGTPGVDGIDDNNNAFVPLDGTESLIPGIGYAITEDEVFPPGSPAATTFTGEFNNGLITATPTTPNLRIYNDPATITAGGAHFHLLGNPYPSALDFDLFHATNSNLIGGLVYLWSQASPPSNTNPGNQVLNFSQNDYAMYTIGAGGISGGNMNANPDNGFIPSGQGFFVPSAGAAFIGDGVNGEPIVFNNSMRSTGTAAGSNDQFFGIEDNNISFSTDNSNNLRNRLWINLTSNNGVFNQILTAYVDGATNDNDGFAYDAPRIPLSGATGVLYTMIDENDTKYAIQGKNPNSLNEDEVIALGFDSSIPVEENTVYTLSVAQFEGAFFENNNVFLKDNLLDVTHNLSVSDYNFTSEVGVFEERFEILFKDVTLSSNEFEIPENQLSIIELETGEVQFRVSDNLIMETIRIMDLTGRELYNFDADGSNATYDLSRLNQSIYIAQITLDNGIVISKKAIKQN